MDEVENPRQWEVGIMYTEGFECGRESVEWEKRHLRPLEFQVEVNDARESCDPTTLFCVRCCNLSGIQDRQTFGVPGGGGGGIRKRAFP